jgi:hypothetical protein
MVLFFGKKSDNFRMEEENIVKYNLRIPKYLYEKVCLAANGNRRSVNNEIIMAITGHVADRGAPTIEDVYALMEEIRKKLDR